MSLAGQVGFVGPGHPDLRGSDVGDHLRLGGAWTRAGMTAATERIERLGLDPAQKAGPPLRWPAAQLALALGLAKRPSC